MHVLDRAANWAHAKPRRKRRIPPQGIVQQSLENIQRNPSDVVDETFNTEVEDQMPPKGSFLEIRRSVLGKSLHFSVCS